MKKSIVRIFTIVLIISIASSTTFIMANAGVQASRYISSYNAQIITSSGGQVLVDCRVTGTDYMDIIGVKTLIIQEYKSGSWVNVASSINLYDYDSPSSNVTSTFYGTPGTQYRAIITFYASLNGGSDSRILTTRSVTATN